jgi:hypothetical protein
MNANATVTATFTAGETLAPTYTLTVQKNGTGTGTVVSAAAVPPAIACGETCSGSYAAGTSVTLNATGLSGSTFGGWSGCTSSTSQCTITMDANATVTATFTAATTSGVLSAAPNPLLFPTVTGVNSISYKMITITNGTSVTQTITSAGADPSAFWVTWGGSCNSIELNKMIPSGGSCTLQFGFKAPAIGVTTGTGKIMFASGTNLTFGLEGKAILPSV